MARIDCANVGKVSRKRRVEPLILRGKMVIKQEDRVILGGHMVSEIWI